MAFDRKVELSVFTQTQKVDISGLHIEFSIERSIEFAENTAEFTIYNAKESTRKEVLKKGNNISFKFGYADESLDETDEVGSTLFAGNISKVTTAQVGPDWITTILAASIQSDQIPLQSTQVKISYSKDVLLSQPLRDIATAMGIVTVTGGTNANINLDNGFTHVGSARSGLKRLRDILKSNNVGLYIDNDQIVVFNKGDRTSRFDPVFLDVESGLLSAEDITDFDNQEDKSQETLKRIGFECIIIPKLQPRGLVTIKASQVDGTFLIEKLAFDGDNFGGENLCSGEATE